MPELDLGAIDALDLTGPCELSAALGDAGYRLAAYMTWPENEARRRQYLAQLGAAAIADFESQQPEELGVAEFAKSHPVEWSEIRKASIEMVMDAHFRAHGGFATITSAPGWDALTAEIEGTAPGWIAAGQILCLVRRMAEHHPDIPGGPSVKKAVELISKCVTDDDAIKDATRLKAAWSRFKSVAHLCASLVEAVTMAIEHDGPVRREILGGAFYFSGLGRSLAVARDYQRFMTTFTPHGQIEPLIPIGRALLVPERARIREMRASVSPLDEDKLKILKEYRSPKLV